MSPHGTYPMLYAFFDADGALRRDAFSRQIEACVSAGAAGVAVLGLGTEANKLTSAERRQVAQWIIEDVAGRTPVAVTIAETGLADAIAAARDARANGASWLILQPPRPPVESAELKRFFGAIADAVDCSVCIQNAPDFLGVGLSNDDLIDLNRQHANIDTVKAETSALAVGRLIDALEGRMAVFNGRAGLELTDNLRAGVAGMIPGTETADLQLGIERAMRAGDEVAAESLYRKVLPAITFIMQGIEHFVLYGKLLAAHRLGLSQSHQRIPSATPAARGEAWINRFAAELGQFAN